MEGTIDACFAELIKNEGWYKASGIDRKLASQHKRHFLARKLKYEIKKMYLQSAGGQIVQEEKWSV